MTTFFALPLMIQLHAGAALLAVAIGPFALWRARRDWLHRTAGLVWIILMLIVATSAWFIHTMRWIGPFSPIHLLALLTYWTLFVALRHARAGRYRAHGTAMRGLYLQALGIAGVFTLLPGRAMNRVLFGDRLGVSIAAMVILGAGVVVLLRRAPRLRIVR